MHVWLAKIKGVPFILRDRCVFDKIGEAFGRTILPSEFSWEDDDISFACGYVLTSIGKRIEEEIIINRRNTSFPVWVNEEMNSWSPLFVDPYQTSKDGDEYKSRDEDISVSSNQEPIIRTELPRESGNISDNRRNSNGSPVVEHGSQDTAHKYNHDASGNNLSTGGESKMLREKIISTDHVPRSAEPDLINDGYCGADRDLEVGLDLHNGLNDTDGMDKECPF
ncbi:hypothetical protein L1987_43897 [Smallanthus sonchifolius]|uniref:Uncharacterized protein n=1 Tax=Smallanthus sonchifolius TaxID=185202 RepID=A0ACB9GMZ0_9ASTR|nr:hypothetical protein L1987_43897 [Smallanthus sonchifolius]